MAATVSTAVTSAPVANNIFVNIPVPAPSSTAILLKPIPRLRRETRPATLIEFRALAISLGGDRVEVGDGAHGGDDSEATRYRV